MLKSVGIAFACMAFAGPLWAGDVRLVSDTLELVCKVDVSWGPEAPTDAQLEVHTDVKKGWSIAKPDKLCYRRPSTPDNCDSGMTQWSTQWKCAESRGDAVETLSLK
jgi:hypothetical protein